MSSVKKEYEFFIQSGIGLESLCHWELLNKWPKVFPKLPLPKTEPIAGGVVLKSPNLMPVHLNFYLKTANRILIRLETFKWRDFPKLFKKIGKINWNHLVGTSQISVQASLTRSRLIHSDRVIETVEKAIAKYRMGNPCSKKIQQLTQGKKKNLYVRIVDDNLTLSLDTSGEHLHKRGQRTKIGAAPLRETLAACLVALVHSHELSYSSVVDPMCGTGQLLGELNTFETSASREFAFQSSPFFESSQSLPLKNDSVVLPQKIFGHDIDPKMVALATEQQDKNIIFLQMDFFKNQFEGLTSQALCLINPPYGKRIELDAPPLKYWERLFCHLLESPKISLLAAIIPREFTDEAFLKKWPPLEKIKSKNGGIPIHLILWDLSKFAT